MSVHEDLSAFPGLVSESGVCFLSIGWIGIDSAFPTGPSPDSFVRKLAALVSTPFIGGPVPAGIHPCELCHPSAVTKSSFAGYTLSSQSSRYILVPSKSAIYVAPEAVGHYVVCHRYLPPGEFQDAVLSCPPPNTQEFKKLFLASGGRSLSKEQ